MKPPPPALAALCLATGLITGCAAIDPYQRPGMWRPEAVNDGNIAAMAQDPRDLVRGHGAGGPLLNGGEAAVERLWRDKVKPFPGDQRTGESTSGSTDGSPQAGDAAAQGGASPQPGGGT